MFKFVLVAGAALAIVPAAGQAAPSQTLVRYADLDLSSAQGQRKLNDRIAVASRSICSRGGDRSIRDMADYRKCRDTALRDASERVQLAIAKDLAAREQVAAR